MPDASSHQEACVVPQRGTPERATAWTEGGLEVTNLQEEEIFWRGDVIVVGAGVAGVALATQLARAGREVLLLDKHKDPPSTLSGELLQPGGVRVLRQLGLEEALEDIGAQPSYGFVVVDGADEAHLPYPDGPPLSQASAADQHPQEATLGFAFHHRRFVEKLRSISSREPGICFLEAHVKALHTEAEQVKGVVFRHQGQEHHALAPLTVLACGRNPLMTAAGRQQKPQRIAHSVGLLLQDAVLPAKHHGHVFLTSPAPTLGYQIDERHTRLLFDFPGELPKRANGALASFLKDEIIPQLPVPLQDAAKTAVAEGAIQSMQNFSMTSERPILGGVVTVGDALSMRHPLTGGGMTVALHDSLCLVENLDACDAFTRGEAALARAIKRYYRRREPMAATIDILSGALHEIFCAREPGLVLMREAVMQYWRRGGIAVAGPMSLLAGLQPSPLRLFLHYCAVALLGAKDQLLASPTPLGWGRVKQSGALLSAATATIGRQLQRGLRLLA